jgi:hypothetical protein
MISLLTCECLTIPTFQPEPAAFNAGSKKSEKSCMPASWHDINSPCWNLPPLLRKRREEEERRRIREEQAWQEPWRG